MGLNSFPQHQPITYLHYNIRLVLCRVPHLFNAPISPLSSTYPDDCDVLLFLQLLYTLLLGMMTIMVLWSFIYWGGVFFLLRLVLFSSFLFWFPTLVFSYKYGIIR